MMDKVLEGFDEFADSFINDISTFSDTWEHHVEHLRAVFQSLREAKLVAKPSKCFVEYGVRSVKGTDMSENCVMNFLLKPLRPKNDRICFCVTGTGNCRIAETLS
jgi:hypothetical protein